MLPDLLPVLQRWQAECPVSTSLILYGSALLSGFIVLRFVLGVLSFAYRHIMKHLPVNLSKYGAKKGAWAVVTGATDGIGLAYAKQLARAGFNILLVSRTKSRLLDAAAEIAKNNSTIKTDIFVLDCSSASDAEYAAFRAHVAKIGVIGVLVNNVGVSYEMPTNFAELDPARMRDLIAINIRATVEITHAVLPIMVTAKKGLIMNLSSGGSLAPCPMLGVYGAAKQFVNSWSVSLAAEYGLRGIHVEYQTPYMVVSKLSKVSRASLQAPTPATYVRCALGMAGTRTHTNPYPVHDLMGSVITSLPEWLQISIIHGQMKGLRAAALRKAERLAAASKSK